MECIDAMNLTSKVLNKNIVNILKKDKEVTINNSHSMHNIATGLKVEGKIIIDGSTGFYTGGFLEEGTVIVDGNTGWYAGDNMMGGELIVNKNTGCNAGAYLSGGTLIIKGSTGSRVGYGMKGGTIIVCGSSGRWAGQMTLGGRLVLLGPISKQVGESMYKGVIFVKDEAIYDNLGGNVFVDEITDEEASQLKELFEANKINEDPYSLKAVRPLTTGRHKYVLFEPMLNPELARKNEFVFDK